MSSPTRAQSRHTYPRVVLREPPEIPDGEETVELAVPRDF